MENENKEAIKTVEVNGKKYTLVHPGTRWYLQTMDKSKNRNGVLMQEKYIEALLTCCVAPKLSIEDFGEDVGSMLGVVNDIETFLGA